jgi:hypothetical protein
MVALLGAKQVGPSLDPTCVMSQSGNITPATGPCSAPVRAAERNGASRAQNHANDVHARPSGVTGHLAFTRSRAEGEPVIEFRDIGNDFPYLPPEFITGQSAYSS